MPARPSLKDAGLNSALIVLGIGLTLVALEAVVRVVHREPVTFLQPHSQIGWMHTPGKEGWSVRPDTAGSRIYLKINSKGLRDREYPYDKPENVFRILVLGDSFAEGKFVDLEESFVKGLERLLHPNHWSRFEVINAGVSGYGTDNELLFYQHEGYKYNADLVLLAFFGNDIVDNAIKMADRWAKWKTTFFVLDNGTLRQTGYFQRPESSTALLVEHLKRPLRDYSALYDLLRKQVSSSLLLNRLLSPLGIISQREFSLYFAPLAQDYSADLEEAWSVTKALIRELDKETRENGSQFLVMMIPYKEQVYSKYWLDAVATYRLGEKGEWDLDKPQRLLAAFLKEEGVAHLDLLPLFRREAKEGVPETYIRGDVHWNAHGHRLAASHVHDYLIQSGLIDKLQRGERNAN